MLRAIIFDCDGVIADSEPLHFAALKRTLEEEGIALSQEEYLAHYLAMDDRGCFKRAFGESGRILDDEKLTELIGRKARHIEPAMQTHLKLLPGAVALIREAARRYPVAIASGALRHEIELIVKLGGVSDCFAAIVSAEDVSRGKPDPESFLKACELLGAALKERIKPAECLVIEDSVHGVRAARAAGMRCLAVTNSYPEEKLAEADRVVASLASVSMSELESIF
jgi:HAD superfamily hydrolase (TIGR01509 family)